MNAKTSQPKHRWNDIDVPLVVTIGVVSIVLVFGVAIPGVKALVYNQESQRRQATAEMSQPRELNQYRQEENDILRGQAGWVDKDRGIARITIDTAIPLYVQRQQENAR